MQRRTHIWSPLGPGQQHSEELVLQTETKPGKLTKDGYEEKSNPKNEGIDQTKHITDEINT
jgi:hypothetical protein